MGTKYKGISAKPNQYMIHMQYTRSNGPMMIEIYSYHYIGISYTTDIIL